MSREPAGSAYESRLAEEQRQTADEQTRKVNEVAKQRKKQKPQEEPTDAE